MRVPNIARAVVNLAGVSVRRAERHGRTGAQRTAAGWVRRQAAQQEMFRARARVGTRAGAAGAGPRSSVAESESSGSTITWSRPTGSSAASSGCWRAARPGADRHRGSLDVGGRLRGAVLASVSSLGCRPAMVLVRERVIALSRGGTALWYEGIAGTLRRDLRSRRAERVRQRRRPHDASAATRSRWKRPNSIAS